MSSNNTNVRITTETVTKQYAEVIVNGTSKGKREINGGPSLKEFASAIAKEFGIRTFTVEVDGDAVTAATATSPVAPGSNVSVQAKDSRGAGRKNKGSQEEAAAPAMTEPETSTQGEVSAQADGDAGEASSEGSEATAEPSSDEPAEAGEEVEEAEATS